MSEQNPIVRRYLEQFRAGLNFVPESEQREIVAEIESHIAEATSSGQSVAETLERLGPADRLARAFAADSILSGQGRPIGKWFSAAAVLAASSLASLIVIPVLGLLGLIFPVAGVVGLFGNLLVLFSFGGENLPHTHLGGWSEPGWSQVIGIGIDLLFVAGGLGLLALLRRYIRFAISTVRSALR